MEGGGIRCFKHRRDHTLKTPKVIDSSMNFSIVGLDNNVAMGRCWFKFGHQDCNRGWFELQSVILHWAACICMSDIKKAVGTIYLQCEDYNVVGFQSSWAIPTMRNSIAIGAATVLGSDENLRLWKSNTECGCSLISLNFLTPRDTMSLKHVQFCCGEQITWKALSGIWPISDAKTHTACWATELYG